MGVGEGRDDGEQDEEERPGVVVLEDPERGGPGCPDKDPYGEEHLDGIEEHTRDEEVPFVAGRKGACGNQNADY